MDIQAQLIKKRSKGSVKAVAQYFKSKPNKLNLLIDCLKIDNELLKYRASWCISTCYDEGIQEISLYGDTFVDVLILNPSSPVKRNLLRVLQWIDVAEEKQGILIDSCFVFVNDIREPIAVKAFALGVLQKFCLLYPDLINELVVVCEEFKKSDSAGIRSRANRIYKFFNK